MKYVPAERQVSARIAAQDITSPAIAGGLAGLYYGGDTIPQ